MTEAIVFLTHSREPRILRHFERLEREAGIDTFLHCDEPSQRWHCPPRYAQMAETGQAVDGGYTDLAFIPPMVALLDRYEHVWHVEYDVDFAGHWGDFFARTRGSSADLLSTTIQSRAENPRWRHWRWAKGPKDFPERRQLKTFYPIMRCSKRMIEAYVNEVLSGGPHRELAGQHRRLSRLSHRRFGTRVRSIPTPRLIATFHLEPSFGCLGREPTITRSRTASNAGFFITQSNLILPLRSA